MDKKTLSESDICDKFIRPAMEAAGWDGMLQIFRDVTPADDVSCASTWMNKSPWQVVLALPVPVPLLVEQSLA